MSLNFSKLVEYAKVFVSSKEMFILPTWASHKAV
jgi:hypothetical protein